MRPRASAITVREVAARAGVALSTVSNVLNRPEVVAPETYARVMSAVSELGYVRNDAARALRLGESNAVGVIVSEASSPFFAEVTQAAGSMLAASGYATLLGNSVQDPRVENDLIGLFEAQRVRGLLISPMSDRPDSLGGFAGRGVPVVYVDVPAPSSEYCSVAGDNHLGARLVIEHLATRGRRRVAIVRGPAEFPQIRDRVAGAAVAARALGVELEEIVTSGYFVNAGVEAAAIIAARPSTGRPDAVFAVNDLLAMGVLAGLIDLDVDVPGEIAVVGYDDVSVASVARRPLTTVRQPAREIGSMSAAMLVDEIERPGAHRHEGKLLAPELVIRATS